jgi:hypothetical protein
MAPCTSSSPLGMTYSFLRIIVFQGKQCGFAVFLTKKGKLYK